MGTKTQRQGTLLERAGAPKEKHTKKQHQYFFVKMNVDLPVLIDVFGGTWFGMMKNGQRDDKETESLREGERQKTETDRQTDRQKEREME